MLIVQMAPRPRNDAPNVRAAGFNLPLPRSLFQCRAITKPDRTLFHAAPFPPRGHLRHRTLPNLRRALTNRKATEVGARALEVILAASVGAA